MNSLKKSLIIYIFTFYCILLIDAQSNLVEVLYKSNHSKPVNIVIMGDGFTASQLRDGSFKRAAANLANDLFNVPPFQQLASLFSVYIVNSVSRQSGSDDAPGKDTRDTIFNSTFGGMGIQRLLIIQDYSAASKYAALATDNPHSIIVLVNDERYGGSGGYYAVVSMNTNSFGVFVHELGHSLGKLTDEYIDESIKDRYPLNPSKMPPNIDIIKSPNEVKWAGFIGIDGYDAVSVFEGGHYRKTGVYRAQENCMMKSIVFGFCSVCREHLAKEILSIAGYDYDFETFLNINPITKDKEIIVRNPTNNKNQKITYEMIHRILSKNQISKDNNNSNIINIKAEPANKNKRYIDKYTYSDGVFLYLGDKKWEERTTGGQNYSYKETGREEWYIYITDYSRNVSLAIPVGHKQAYIYSDKKWVVLYELIKS